MDGPPVDGVAPLGGRLPLLHPADLDEEQREVYEALTATVVPGAAESGFTARLDDGRFVGPFNALLRVPRLALGFGRWTSEIARSALADDVRQVVILTVGAAWAADYAIDAHRSAARVVGVPDDAVAAILEGRPPEGLTAPAATAHRLTASLLADHRVPHDLYVDALDQFGESGLIGILSLIGQYQMISSILTCFEVPVAYGDRERRSDTTERT